MVFAWLTKEEEEEGPRQGQVGNDDEYVDSPETALAKETGLRENRPMCFFILFPDACSPHTAIPRGGIIRRKKRRQAVRIFSRIIKGNPEDYMCPSGLPACCAVAGGGTTTRERRIAPGRKMERKGREKQKTKRWKGPSFNGHTRGSFTSPMGAALMGLWASEAYSSRLLHVLFSFRFYSIIPIYIYNANATPDPPGTSFVVGFADALQIHP